MKDISIAKNYLNDEELKILNNIVSGYFDFAEIQAMRYNPMYMADYVDHLDNVLKTTGEKVLQGAGTLILGEGGGVLAGNGVVFLKE